MIYDIFIKLTPITVVFSICIPHQLFLTLPCMQEVLPDDAELPTLLGDPKAAVRKWFPTETGHSRRPAAVLEGNRSPGLAWTNHCFSVNVMVMELHALATGKALLPLVLGIIPDKFITNQKPRVVI